MEKKYIEDEGINLGDIFKVFWKRKIIIAISMLVGLILLFLVVRIGYNPTHRKYSSEFELVFHSATVDEEGNKIYDTYPTGRSFNYKNIISKENLNKVISSNEKYSVLNAEELFEGNYIKIEMKDNKNYEISIQGLRKGDAQIYKSLIKDLINNTIDDINSDILKLDYVSGLKSFKNYTTYDGSISFLQEKKDFLVSSYNTLIEEFSGYYIVNSKPLQAYADEIQSYFSSVNFDGLIAQAKKNYYVSDPESYSIALNLEISSLKKKYEQNLVMISELKDVYATSAPGVTDSFQSIITRIGELTEENVQLREQMLDLGYNPDTNIVTATFTYNEEFDKKVNDVYQKLLDISSIFEENIKEIYKDQTQVTYENNSIIVVSGNMSNLIVIAGGLILGLIVGAMIALVLEYSFKKKDNEDEEQVEK